MKHLLIIILLSGCAGAPTRTKWSDPSMRILLNPQGLDSTSYVRLQQALVKSGKWFVVDRSKAFRAVVDEQSLTRINYPSRFDDSEKFARLGKMFGAGGVVQGNLQCSNSRGFWGTTVPCVLNLVIVSTVTGEIIASAEVQDDAEINYFGEVVIAPSWENAVSALNDNFPKNYKLPEWTDGMKVFKEIIKEEAQREREDGIARGSY
jgi:hypothetical protein